MELDKILKQLKQDILTLLKGVPKDNLSTNYGGNKGYPIPPDMNIQDFCDKTFTGQMRLINLLTKRVKVLEFELHNPPKYKIGDRLRDNKYLIIEEEIEDGELRNSIGFYRVYIVVNTLTREKDQIREDKL